MRYTVTVTHIGGHTIDPPIVIPIDADSRDEALEILRSGISLAARQSDADPPPPIRLTLDADGGGTWSLADVGGVG